MIPSNLHWAFEEGHRVFTLGGRGKTRRHRLADLVLRSGKIATGYPGNDFVNEPNQIQPQVSPGSYPVYINVVRNKGATGAFVFVAVSFANTETIAWESAGKFFTDSGDGCIFDATVTELLRKKRKEMLREEWAQLKTAALHDGDGNLILDAASGANAIIFRTNDWSYHCFIGRDSHEHVSSLVIDGRGQQSDEGRFRSFLRRLMTPKAIRK